MHKCFNCKKIDKTKRYTKDVQTGRCSDLMETIFIVGFELSLVKMIKELDAQHESWNPHRISSELKYTHLTAKQMEQRQGKVEVALFYV